MTLEKEINNIEEEESIYEKRESMVAAFEKEDPDKIPKSVATLLQFQALPKEYLVAYQLKATKAIKMHLQKYSRIKDESRTAYGEKSDMIERICQSCAKRLTKGKGVSSIQLFQAKWLTNIARLLPEDPAVLKILPYLITCYIISAPQNRLDPFDSPQNMASSGWRDIFYELREEKDRCSANNVNSSIDSICRSFCLPIQGRNETFFYDGISNNRAEKNKRRGRPNKSGNQNSLSKNALEKKQILSWEYYRDFLILCSICNKAKIKDLNIVLSMALFTSIWDWGDIDTYDSGLNRRIRQFTKSEVETEMVVPQDLDGNTYKPKSLRNYIIRLNWESTSKNMTPTKIVENLFSPLQPEKKERKRLDDEFENYGIYFDP